MHAKQFACPMDVFTCTQCGVLCTYQEHVQYIDTFVVLGSSHSRSHIEAQIDHLQSAVCIIVALNVHTNNWYLVYGDDWQSSVCQVILSSDLTNFNI